MYTIGLLSIAHSDLTRIAENMENMSVSHRQGQSINKYMWV